MCMPCFFVLLQSFTQFVYSIRTFPLLPCTLFSCPLLPSKSGDFRQTHHSSSNTRESKAIRIHSDKIPQIQPPKQHQTAPKLPKSFDNPSKMANRAPVVPTYFPDPMYHLAVRIPLYSTQADRTVDTYAGPGPDSPGGATQKDQSGAEDPYNEEMPDRPLNRSQKWLKEMRTNLQSVHLYKVHRMYTDQERLQLSDKVYYFKGVGFPVEGAPQEPSELIINRRKAVPREDKTTNCGEFPNEIEFSTLWDPVSKRETGRYLLRDLPYFPRLMGYTLHKVKSRSHGKIFPSLLEHSKEQIVSSSESDQEPDARGRTRPKKSKISPGKQNLSRGQNIFSMYFEYFNGGNIESFFRKSCERFVDGSQVSESKVPETLVWHVLAEIGSAIIKLQTGEHKLLGSNKAVTEKGWKPIVHRAINTTNVYLHFNEDDFNSSNQAKRLEARCFPRVVLNNFSMACEVDTAVDVAPLAEYEPPKKPWWDIYCFGVLLRKMIFFNDQRPHLEPSTDYVYENDSLILPDTLDEYQSPGDPRQVLKARNKVYSDPLINLLKMFDPPQGLLTNNDDLLVPQNRASFPDINALKTAVDTAKQKVAEFKGMTLDTLPKETFKTSNVSWAGPQDDNTGNIMLYRPPKVEDVVMWKQLEADLKNFQGPVKAARVEYTHNGVLIDGRQIQAGRMEVIPFRLDDEDEGGVKGNDKGKKKGKKRKRSPLAGDPNYENTNEADNQHRKNRTRTSPPTDDPEANEADYQLRRKIIRDQQRPDTLLETWNAVFFQGPRKPWWKGLKSGRDRVRGEIAFLHRWDEENEREFYRADMKDAFELEEEKRGGEGYNSQDDPGLSGVDDDGSSNDGDGGGGDSDDGDCK